MSTAAGMGAPERRSSGGRRWKIVLALLTFACTTVVLRSPSAGASAMGSPAQCYAPGWVTSNMPTLVSRNGGLQNVSFSLGVYDKQGRLVAVSPVFLATANRYGISWNPRTGASWYNSVTYAGTFRTDVWVGKGDFDVYAVYAWDDGYTSWEHLPVNGWTSTQCLIK